MIAISTNDSMRSVVPYLAHYGILGQEWGKRRFQNYDGTLTEAGKARYRKLEQRAKDAEDKYKKAVARTPSRAMRWNDIGIYAYDKKMRKINSLHAKSERAKAEFEKFKESLGDEILKAKKDNGTSEATDASATTEIRNDADDSLRKGLKELLPADSGEMSDKFDHGTEEEKKRFRDAADLGLEALEKMGRDIGEDVGDDADLESRREWFLFEDQTIGMGTVADYINQGHTAKEAKELIDKIDNMSFDEVHALEKKISEREQGALFDIRNGYGLKDFADECEKVKASKDPEYLEKVKTSSGDTRYFYDKSELKAYKDGKSGASDKDLDDAFKKMRNSSKTDEEKDLKEHYWNNAKDNDRWDINFLEAVQNSAILERNDKKSLLTEYAKYMADPSDYWENGRHQLEDASFARDWKIGHF